MSPSPSGRPGYADLTPAEILDALDAVGLRPDGRLLELNSYENRVHQVFLEDGGAVVTKFYRPGRWSNAQILEEHAYALELAAAEVPVVAPLTLSVPAEDVPVRLEGNPPTLACLTLPGGADHRFSVSPRCAGREPELDDPQTQQRIGAFIGRMHAVGARRAFSHRVRLDPPADARAAAARLLELAVVPPDVLPAWRSGVEHALDAVAQAFHRHGPLATLRLHCDCHPGNVLWRNDSPNAVDLDDACTGPAVQDLWMLVSGDAGSMASQLARLLEGYEQFRDFDRRELMLIEPLRTVRMVRHAAWIAERWHDPAFPRAFGYFGTAAYWQQQATQLREQLELMLSPPAD